MGDRGECKINEGDQDLWTAVGEWVCPHQISSSSIVFLPKFIITGLSNPQYSSHLCAVPLCYFSSCVCSCSLPRCNLSASQRRSAFFLEASLQFPCEALFVSWSFLRILASFLAELSLCLTSGCYPCDAPHRFFWITVHSPDFVPHCNAISISPSGAPYWWLSSCGAPSRTSPLWCLPCLPSRCS